MTKIEPRLLKGFRDFGPQEQLVRQELFSKIQAVFERFGFLPLSTPILEYKDILMGKYGDDQKLVYSFKDHGDRDVAIRYDLTVPLARYVAQNQGQLTFPFKRYQIAPVLRADNPQKGRLREFYQCDVDVVGTDSALADAEVIACICQALEAVGVTKFQIRLNDRRVFAEFEQSLGLESAQVTTVIREIDKVNKIGKEAVLESLRSQRIPEAAVARANRFLEAGSDLQKLTGDVSDAVIQNLNDLKQQILAFGIGGEKIQFDFTIARGLDYYTNIQLFYFALTFRDFYCTLVCLRRTYEIGYFFLRENSG